MRKNYPKTTLKLHQFPHLSAYGIFDGIYERFWSRVDQNGAIPIHMPELGRCWNWVGIKNKWGYGIINTGGDKSNRTASRVSWLLHVGGFGDGLWVLHKCDNPACIRPSHLFLGDAKTNVQDMIKKGRQGPPPRAKLNFEKADEIRKRHANGESYKSLAEAFGVGTPAISKIITFSRWHPSHKIIS